MSTSSEKAKNDLLNSMRVSKDGSSAAESKPAAAKKPAAKKKAAKKPAAKKTSKKPAAKKASASGANGFSSREGRASVAADGFESGQRIWPD